MSTVTLTHSIKKTLALGVVCVASVMLFGGAYSWLDTMRAQVHGIRDELEQTRSNKDRDSQLRDMLAKTVEDRAYLTAHLLNSSEPSVFLDQIESLKQTSGASLTVESITEVANTALRTGAPHEQGVSFVRVVLTVSGVWNHVYHLIQLLETVPYAMLVDQITLEQGDDDVNEWSGHIELLVAAANSHE